VVVQADFAFERRAKSAARWIAGVDEAGRGPLAGPVVAAAVILNPRRRIQGLGDSKEICAEERERLAVLIRQRATAWSVAWADVAEIDSLNILQATFLAMRRAVCGLRIAPDHVRIDGNRAPSMVEMGIHCGVQTIVKGDALVDSIGAASILAKTVRDAMMVRLDAIYPGYEFSRHKGYGTRSHYAALKKLGPSVIHRRSFEPVRLASLEGTPLDLFEFAFSNGELDEEMDESDDLALSAG
jgi:ribonuclease HII